MAFIRFFSGVRPPVLLKMGELCKLALAELASVRFDSGVDSHVLRQVRGVGETLGTGRAFVRLRVLLVDVVRVPQHVGFRIERLLAEFAIVGFGSPISAETVAVGRFERSAGDAEMRLLQHLVDW